MAKTWRHEVKGLPWAWAGHEICCIFHIFPVCKHTGCCCCNAWMSEGKEKTWTSAASGERYFYLWPRFSIKYWRWKSKDSLDDIKTEWWLCRSLKWHSGVWRGMSSTYCIVHKEMTGDWSPSPLTFKKHLHLYEIKRNLQIHGFHLMCILQQQYSGSPLGHITTAKSKAESHLDLWVRLWSDPHHSLVININFNNLQISSYRVLRLQATGFCVSLFHVCDRNHRSDVGQREIWQRLCLLLLSDSWAEHI